MQLQRLQVQLILDDSEDGGINRFYIETNEDTDYYDHMCEEIVNIIPMVPFDVDCDGYPSRQAEAAALSKCAAAN